jgi:hypothetical protein
MKVPLPKDRKTFAMPFITGSLPGPEGRGSGGVRGGRGKDSRGGKGEGEGRGLLQLLAKRIMSRMQYCPWLVYPRDYPPGVFPGYSA